MIEVGRSEKIIKEMDQLASEDHTYKATREEIDVYRGNWWIHTNAAHFDSASKRRCRQCTASSKRRTTRNMQHGHTIPPLLGNGMQTGGSPILSTRLKDGMTTDSTGQPVTWWFAIHLRKESQQAENSELFFIKNKSVTADGSLLSSTGGCKYNTSCT